MVVRSIVGFLLCAVGAVWFCQGIGVIHGSAMTGKGLWAIIGAVLLALGLATLAWVFALRQR
jgi:hypothetical protein